MSLQKKYYWCPSEECLLSKHHFSSQDSLDCHAIQYHELDLEPDSFSEGGTYTKKEMLPAPLFADDSITAWRCERDTDKKLFDVHIIDKKLAQRNAVQLLLKQVNIMKIISHPNCVQFHGLVQTKREMFLIYEMVDGPCLFDVILEKHALSEPEAAVSIATIASTLRYLHGVGVVHGDINLKACYLKTTAERDLKLGGFESAKLLKHTNNLIKSGSAGALEYSAPEVISGKPYGPACDLWSLGFLGYVLLCGYAPFKNEHGQTLAIFKHIMNGNFSFPAEPWDHVSDDAKSLIKGLLCVDPQKRLTSDQVLQHPWVLAHCVGTQHDTTIPYACEASGAPSAQATATATTNTAVI